MTTTQSPPLSAATNRTGLWSYSAYASIGIRQPRGRRDGLEKKMGKRFKSFAAVCFLGGGLLVGAASSASAAPSGHASCVAQFVHAFGDPGHGGETGGPVGGKEVSQVAHIPLDVCAAIITGP